MFQVETHGTALIRARRQNGPASFPPPPAGPGGVEGGGGGGVHFAPFRPEAEDHLRSFTVSPEERRQMEEDYKLALAMQKGETAETEGGGAARRGGSGEKYLAVITLRMPRAVRPSTTRPPGATVHCSRGSDRLPMAKRSVICYFMPEVVGSKRVIPTSIVSALWAGQLFFSFFFPG